MADQADAVFEVTEEDALRAQCYTLLGRLLSAAPDQAMLDWLGRIDGDDTDIGGALKALATMARKSSPDDLCKEFDALFIGVVQGEITPYASYYLTGFLHEKPLARLRADMIRLGIARNEDVSEPEDHIASICEMMAGMILGVFGPQASLAEQQAFFDQHLGSWAPRLFEHIEAAREARFYMPVGTFGRLFMEVENQAFQMAA